ncbi:hypothetical protein F0562_005615 [Nyssa sinensis]|uniref:Uncharacterized protein n=1 Tax=Nyssa sinensis TaxID=561372 RepID=A0A5J5AMM4_9ASTE|nr:hypothetical protein F0562_005615 [Nyssa sinensis]
MKVYIHPGGGERERVEGVGGGILKLGIDAEGWWRKKARLYREVAMVEGWPERPTEVFDGRERSWEDVAVNFEACEGRLENRRCLVGRVGKMSAPVLARQSIQQESPDTIVVVAKIMIQENTVKTIKHEFLQQIEVGLAIIEVQTLLYILQLLSNHLGLRGLSTGGLRHYILQNQGSYKLNTDGSLRSNPSSASILALIRVLRDDDDTDLSHGNNFSLRCCFY